MKRFTLVLAVGALAVGVALAGCTEEADPADTTIAAVDTTTVTSEPMSTTTAAVATTTTEPMDPDAACVDCHTDQEALFALAVEPVDTESLSSGEG
jgi:PBP1b-binding outer membrane lipoprotein LpoB